ncbi:PREDICTED: uncharacterized protein LOC106743544 [Dinoponera quadriceps]|uniref:Uncharacterized protein LOC106743544 n=1 Tax=Dinoponera quadriceps TaxID=609295 RepID=A0A6P3X3P2_DINQU|nr:PREDICTED: uncharacterized protein LOC106743544 [Dinoponera quadriceps]
MLENVRNYSDPRLLNRIGCSSGGKDAMSGLNVGRDINGRCFVSPPDRSPRSSSLGPLFPMARWGSRYRGRNASSKNASADQCAKLGTNKRRSASVGTSSRETRSSKDENSVKCRAMRSQGPRLLSSQKENKKDVKTAEHVPGHKGRLFSDETSDGTDDPIYNLRKEIRDWRASGQLNERLITEDETKEDVLRVDYGQVTAKNPTDPDVLPGLPSVVIRLT